MEGFSSIDTTKNNNKVTQGNNEKLYIMKLPKNFNIEELNGVKLKLSKKSNTNVIYTNDKVEIVLEDVDAFNIMCPIVSNKNSHSFGTKFDGALSINEVINNTNDDPNDVDMDSVLEGLPIKVAYGKVEQNKDLNVNFMPYGSLSLPSELQQRKKQAMKEDRKKKRSKEEEDGEKKKKKKKKESE